MVKNKKSNKPPELPGTRFRTAGVTVAALGENGRAMALPGTAKSFVDRARNKIPHEQIRAAAERFDGRVIVGVATDPTVDYYNERVLPDGAKDSLPAYFANGGLFAANHRYVNRRGEPTIIGSVTWVAVDKDGMYFVAGFDDDELSALWWSKYRKGIVRGISIGFFPEEWDWEDYVTDEGKTRKRLVHLTWRLLEISAAPLQANPEAGAGPVELSGEEAIRGLFEGLSKELLARVEARLNLCEARVRAAADEVIAAGDAGDFCDETDGTFASTEKGHNDEGDAARQRVFTRASVLRALDDVLKHKGV